MSARRNAKVTVAVLCVLLLSLAVWSVVAAQESTPEATPSPESAAEATPEAANARPFLGVRVSDADGTVVVEEVVANSAADEAGLEVGDVITAVNGTDVASASALADAIAALQSGDTVTIDYTRDGETATATATLGTAPEAATPAQPGTPRGPRGPRGQRGQEDFGLTYDPANQTWTITRLSEDSVLYEAGLREGDVITAINGEPPIPMSLFRAQPDENGNVTLTVERDGQSQDIEISASDLMVFGMGGMFNFGNGRDMGMPFGFWQFGQMSDRGWLGISYVTLDQQTAADNNVDVTEGALVKEVVASSPAETAGLQENDIITAVNGEAVDEEHTLSDRLIAYEQDDTITLDVLRDGDTQQIEVTLGQPTNAAMMPSFGFNFGNPGSLIPRGGMPFGRTQPAEQPNL